MNFIEVYFDRAYGASCHSQVLMYGKFQPRFDYHFDEEPEERLINTCFTLRLRVAITYALESLKLMHVLIKESTNLFLGGLA